MRENLRIGRWPFDMDRFGCVHLDDANYAAVRCKRNSDGGGCFNQTSSGKPREGFRRSICNPKCSLVRVRDCSAWKGVNLSPFSGETGHPPWCEEGLPTFTLG